MEGLTPALKGANHLGDIGDISCTDAILSGSLWGQERRESSQAVQPGVGV